MKVINQGSGLPTALTTTHLAGSSKNTTPNQPMFLIPTDFINLKKARVARTLPSKVATNIAQVPGITKSNTDTIAGYSGK